MTPIKLLRANFPWPEKKPSLDQDFGPTWFTAGHPKYLEQFATRDVKTVLELGSFVGRSTAWFCSILPWAQIVCVDHWQGSPEHVGTVDAYLPNLYERFLANMWHERKRVTPVRRCTTEGMTYVFSAKIRPDLIYVDAAHDEQSLVEDLVVAMTLFPRAQIVGDDYHCCKGVQLGVDWILRKHKELKLRTSGPLFWLERIRAVS